MCKSFKKNKYTVLQRIKRIKPYFSGTGSNSTKLALVEKDMIITDEKQILDLMSESFVNIIKS